MCDQQSLRSAWAYAQSDQSLCKSLERSMTVELLNEHDLEFICLKGVGCTGSYESTLVKMPHCWKSHVTAQRCLQNTSVFTGTNMSTGDLKFKGIRKFLDLNIMQKVDKQKTLEMEMLYKDLLVKISTIIDENELGKCIM